MLFSVFFIWSLFFLFCMCIYVCTCVLMLTCMQCVCYTYVHVHMEARSQHWISFFRCRPSFWWQVPSPTWCSLALLPPPPQCAPLDPAFMATWQAFHWLSISSDLDSFSCHQHLHVLLSNSLSLIFVYFCPYVCLPRFPQIVLAFTFLSSLSMTKKLNGFCSRELILGLVVHIPFFFAFLAPPRIHMRGHYPGLP